ncbi:hypothetical protein [Alicyclobacillus ferrooxydans]|uniref:Uncharacterized protein n=1 Tax=Alicyclobacillus ferrooxydans TaxID=471514 RepID=A0A0P9CM89_9BACL|nr:hypothetical protein [Alicyclobacillus ferrooxydans]KPV44078.1 hypothetical protein AN477_08335 [Alicyclobacillus ferrooxydans]
MSFLHNGIFLFLCFVVGLGILSGLIERFLAPKRRKKRGAEKKSHNSTRKTSSSNNRKSSSRSSDDVILRTPIDKLTWSEFERLFALYFRSQGFLVEELGVGGNDGGD